MHTVFPDYYSDFHCIADKCRHNCCIGWEIDIDEDTLAFYDTVEGEMGARLRREIDRAETPHFCLGKDGRCPFLNAQNLCDIYTALGEAHLSEICKAHPRFFNELPDRVEGGVGMACEEAARLIITKKTPMRLCDAPPSDDAVLQLREAVFACLQNREKPFAARISDMLSLCGTALPRFTADGLYALLAPLERLDEAWSDTLALLNETAPDYAAFDRHMAGRETEYEQWTVYLIYRYFANAPTLEDAAVHAAFAAFGYAVLYALGGAIFAKRGDFTVEDQIELCRAFSSEIEYCEENHYALLDALE